MTNYVVEPVSGCLPVAGAELWYEMQGTGSAVVLLHAGMLDSRMWDEQFELLGTNWTVIRYDARSHGRSTTTSRDFAHHDDLRMLLTALNVDRAVLVGLSLGARTAVDFAVEYPSRVSGLVLASPGISGWTFTDPVLAHHQQEMLAAAESGSLAAAAEWFTRMWVDGPQRSAEEVDARLRARMKSMITENVKRHHAGEGSIVEVGAAARLHELTVPVLTMLGGRDSSDIHAIVAAVVSAVPDALCVRIPNAGHMLNLEAPDAFNTALLDFLGDTDQRWLTQ